MTYNSHCCFVFGALEEEEEGTETTTVIISFRLEVTVGLKSDVTNRNRERGSGCRCVARWQAGQTVKPSQKYFFHQRESVG